MHLEHREPDYAALTKKADAAFACTHQVVVRSKKIKSNGDPEIRDQCQRCGSQIGHAIRRATMSQAQIDSLPAWSDQIAIRHCAERNRFYMEALAGEKERLLADWRQRYNLYLESPEWRQRRQLVLARAQNICEGCRTEKATRVHHLTYENVGEEMLFQLVALCVPCHARCHAPEPPGYIPPPKQPAPSPAQ